MLEVAPFQIIRPGSLVHVADVREHHVTPFGHAQNRFEFGLGIAEVFPSLDQPISLGLGNLDQAGEAEQLATYKTNMTN